MRAGERHRLRDGRGRGRGGADHPGRPELLEVPVERVRPRHEGPIVLEELAEPDEDLAEVDDAADTGKEPFRVRSVVHRGDGPVVQLDDRAVEPVAHPDRRRLAGVLELHLGADGDEVLQHDHRRGREPARREARRPRTPIDETEPSGPIRVREDRAAADRILQVLRLVRVVLVAGVLAELRKELPAIEAELVDDLAELRRLLAEPLGDDEAGAAAEAVRRDPRQVPERAHLGVALGRLSRDGDGQMGHDALDLLGGRDVLQVLVELVQGNLLLEAADLGRLRTVGGDAEVAPDDVGEQHAQRLRRPPGGPDRARVVELQVRRRRAERAELDVGEPLERGDEDPFRQDGEPDVERHLDPVPDRPRARRVACEPTGEGDGDLLAGHRPREGPDLLGDPVDVQVREQLLDAARHVLRARISGSRNGSTPDRRAVAAASYARSMPCSSCRKYDSTGRRTGLGS